MATHDLRPLYEAIVIAIGGPPHRGKSVFLYALYRALLALRPQNFAFLIRGNPDGEGMWSQETSDEIRGDIRQKGEFSPEIVNDVLSQIVGSALLGTFKVLFLDLGGRMSEQNAEFLRHSTHLITLAASEEEAAEWVEFAKQQGCKTLAVLGSRLIKLPSGELDMAAQASVDVSTYPVRGELVNLDRDTASDPYHEAIELLAEWLVEFIEGADEV